MLDWLMSASGPAVGVLIAGLILFFVQRAYSKKDAKDKQVKDLVEKVREIEMRLAVLEAKFDQGTSKINVTKLPEKPKYFISKSRVEPPKTD